MKRLLFSLLIFLPVLVFAQRFNGGIIAGGNVSQLDGDTYQGYHKFGFLGGAYVNYRFSRHSQVQMELEYIQKGSRKNGDSVDVSTYLLRLHYLEIPVLYQFFLNDKLSLEIGPAADVLLGSYEEKDGLEVPYNTMPLRNVTLAGIFGVSYFLTDHLKADFRFNYSLLSIRQPSSDGYPEGYRKILFETGQYNNLMSLSLSWDFLTPDW